VSGIAEQFETTAEEQESGLVGMWIFLATEVLFFGVLFFVYSVARVQYGAAFAAASKHTDVILGTCNTAILLTSSLTMALAVRASELRDAVQTRRWLGATMALGAVFLIIKGVEYHKEFAEHLVPHFDFQFDDAHLVGAGIFFSLYFVMTGLHALHLLIGIAILGVLARRVTTARKRTERRGTVEVAGLYWHFIDLVWIFLYPLLYLVLRT
jgi:cytochrome c oxidase subunit 3